MKLRAMIIDDEVFVREDLRYMLASNNDIEVVCESGTINEAKKLLSENSVDVVFLDIQLRGGSGFDLVPFIDRPTEIIFITAYDEYAVRAFEVNALDYILKPVTENRLAESIERLKSGLRGIKTASPKAGPYKPDDRIFVKTDSGQVFVCLEDILSISSIGGNYVNLTLKGGESLLSRITLKEWEKTLPESIFFRIHRATIINLKSIERIDYQKDGSCLVSLSGLKDTCTVSRRMAPGLKNLV